MSHPSLRQQAYEKIHQWIDHGDFAKGSVISEVQLSRMLDMSRTPIRAALQQLELEGYLRIAAKHGILILDSSSQRVSDLLEVIISLVLFSVDVSWNSKREERIGLSRNLQDAIFHEELDLLDSNLLQELIQREADLFDQLISLSNNSEMTKIYHSTISRLFWKHNLRRWQAPYLSITTIQVKNLLQCLQVDREAFREAAALYLQTLKRTWQ